MTSLPPARARRVLRSLALAAVSASLGAARIPAQEPAAESTEVASPAASAIPRSGPLFVPNRGGWDPAVRFAVVHGPTPAWIEADGFRLLGQGAEGGTVLRFAFEGGAAKRIEGLGEPRAAVHRLVGAQRGGGDAFGAVRFEAVWPGIDVVVRSDPEAGAAGALAYDLHVAPGAELSRAVLRVEGAASVTLLDDGQLEIVGTAEDGVDPLRLVQRAPVSWNLAADGGKQSVHVRFSDLGAGRFGFVATARETTRPLVVDPGFTWVGYLGRNASDRIEAVAVREDGVWVTGFAGSSLFPTTPGAWRETGGRDVFVSKLSPDGRELLWSTFFGGTQADVGRAIDVAPDGSVWFGGNTSSTDLPVTADAVQPVFGGYGPLLAIGDGFLARLSADGAALRYCSYLGGGGDDFVEMVRAVSDDEVVFAGYCDSDDLQTTPGCLQPAFGSASLIVPDAFVGRLGGGGATLDWLTYFGGQAMEFVADAEVAPDGSVWICGWTGSIDYPATPGAVRTTVGGLWDGYVARISADGASLLASTLLGGEGPDQARGLAVDPVSGDCFVVGSALELIRSLPLGTQGWQIDPFGDAEGFVFRVAHDAASLRAVTLLGGTLADLPLDATVLGDGSLVVVGATEGGDLPVGAQAPQPTFGGGVNDGFVARFDPWLRQAPSRTFLGGTEKEQLVAVAAVPGTTEVVAVGATESAGLAVGSPFSNRYWGGLDGLVARIDVGGISAGAVEVSPRGAPIADGVTFAVGDSVDLALRIHNGTGAAVEFGSLDVLVASQGGLAGTVRTLAVVEDVDGDGRAGAGEPFLAGPLPVDRADLAMSFGRRSLEVGADLDVVLSLATDPMCPEGRELFMGVLDPAALSLRSVADGRAATVTFLGQPASSAVALQSAVWVAGKRIDLDLDQDGDLAVTVLDVRRLAVWQGGAATAREDLDGDGSITAVEVDAAVDVLLGRPGVALDERTVAAGGVLELRGLGLDAETIVRLGGRVLKPLGGGEHLRAYAVPAGLSAGNYPVEVLRAGGTPRSLGELEVQ